MNHNNLQGLTKKQRDIGELRKVIQDITEKSAKLQDDDEWFKHKNYENKDVQSTSLECLVKLCIIIEKKYSNDQNKLEEEIDELYRNLYLK